jgi:RNase P subunit RPR2
MHHHTDSNNGHSRSKPIGVTSISEWRCTQCGKLLGMANGNQLHIRVQKHREYLVGLPVTANCHGCGTLNRKSAS